MVFKKVNVTTVCIVLLGFCFKLQPFEFTSYFSTKGLFANEDDEPYSPKDDDDGATSTVGPVSSEVVPPEASKQDLGAELERINKMIEADKQFIESISSKLGTSASEEQEKPPEETNLERVFKSCSFRS